MGYQDQSNLANHILSLEDNELLAKLVHMISSTMTNKLIPDHNHYYIHYFGQKLGLKMSNDFI